MKKLLAGIAITGGLVALYATTRGRRTPQVTVTRTITTPIETAFNYILPINLAHAFRGTAFIPAIVDTTIKEGWNAVGQSRILYFKDGSSSRETLLTMSPPHSFTYTIDDFSSPVLKSLVTRLEGEWRFGSLPGAQTKLEWTYRAIPANLAAQILIDSILMKMLRSMLEGAISIAANDLETGQLAAGTYR